MPKSRFHSTLEGKIKELINNRAISLIEGAAIDYGQYRQQVGFAEGLRTVLLICEEIEQEFEV